MDGILTASVHVGNSDLVCGFVYEDSYQLLDIISRIKHMDGVDRVTWSEEVFELPVNSKNILSSFKRFWSNGDNGNNGNGNNRFKQINSRKSSKRKVRF